MQHFSLAFFSTFLLNRDSGWIKIMIQDKHDLSAILCSIIVVKNKSHSCVAVDAYSD
jgi:hypothetical protein